MRNWFLLDWVVAEEDRVERRAWPLLGLLGLLLLAFAALIVIEPMVLVALTAALAGVAGWLMLTLAVALAWDAWKRRPRKIPIRIVRH